MQTRKQECGSMMRSAVAVRVGPFGSPALRWAAPQLLRTEGTNPDDERSEEFVYLYRDKLTPPYSAGQTRTRTRSESKQV